MLKKDSIVKIKLHLFDKKNEFLLDRHEHYYIENIKEIDNITYVFYITFDDYKNKRYGTIPNVLTINYFNNLVDLSKNKDSIKILAEFKHIKRKRKIKDLFNNIR